MSLSEIDEKAFMAFNKFMALKNHFSLDNYDYLKYNGKTNVRKDSFILRKDKMMFLKLSSIPHPLEDFLISNFSVDENYWLDSLLDNNIGNLNYIEWKNKLDRISFHIKTQLANCQIDTYKDLKRLFYVKENKLPTIISLYREGKISLETFTIIYHILNVDEYWKNNLKEKFISPRIMKKIRKYEYLLVRRIDKNKIENMISLMDKEN